MATCKECLHFGKCWIMQGYGGGNPDDAPCEDFANKADFEKVVRCRNCKFWSEDGRCEPMRNGLTEEYTLGVDYCSYGERKEDEKLN